MQLVASFFVLYIGFFIIAISMTRHRRQLLPQIKTLKPAVVWALRIIGWVALAIGLMLCIDQYGFGIGMTLWTGMLTVAALLLAMLAQYLPRFVFVLIPVAIFSWALA